MKGGDTLFDTTTYDSFAAATLRLTTPVLKAGETRFALDFQTLKRGRRESSINRRTN